jgi:hypothetical protein
VYSLVGQGEFVVKKLCVVIGLLFLAVLVRPGHAGAQTPMRIAVGADAAPVFVRPDTTMTPLSIAKERSVLNVIASESEWYRIEWQDPQWGRRVGYIEKRHVSGQMATPLQEPVDVSVPEFSPARSVSDLEQLQIRRAAPGGQGSVPTTPRQPTRPPAVTHPGV